MATNVWKPSVLLHDSQRRIGAIIAPGDRGCVHSSSAWVCAIVLLWNAWDGVRCCKAVQCMSSPAWLGLACLLCSQTRGRCIICGCRRVRGPRRRADAADVLDALCTCAVGVHGETATRACTQGQFESSVCLLPSRSDGCRIRRTRARDRVSGEGLGQSTNLAVSTSAQQKLTILHDFWAAPANFCTWPPEPACFVLTSACRLFGW